MQVGPAHDATNNGAIQVFASLCNVRPDLSIVVPAYKTADYVDTTLQSLSSAGLKGREFIVVIDGSPDDSEAVAVDWFQRTGAEGLVLRTTNAGLSAARNTGARHARGEHLCFFDSDDIADASTHDVMLAACRAHDADLATAGAVCLDSRTGGLWDFPDASLRDELLLHRSVSVTTLAREPRVLGLEPNMSTHVFRRVFYEQHRLRFPEGLNFEDFPVHVRAARLARRIVLVKNTVLYYRVNRPGQITSQHGTSRFDVLETAAMALEEGTKIDIEQARCCLVGMAINLLFWCGKHVHLEERDRFFERAVSLIEPYRDLIRLRDDQSRAEPVEAVLAAFKEGDALRLWSLALILKKDIRLPQAVEQEARDIAALQAPPVVVEEPAQDIAETTQGGAEEGSPGLLQRFRRRRERAGV